MLSPFGLKITRLASPKSLSDTESNPAGIGDDYDWGIYPSEYKAQLDSMQRAWTQKLQKGDFVLTDGSIALRDGLQPLHPNHSCLYETVGALKPATAIEVGCGGGDHLHNIGMIYPDIEIRGFDRSEGQLDFLRHRSPHLAPLVETRDITLPPSRNLPKADLVYSQAVIMHIQAGNSHLVALSGMFRMARRFVVLMENFKKHSFVEDIKRLHHEQMIDWDVVRFYFHRHGGKPRILIVSQDELPLEELKEYSQLTEAMD